MSRSSVRNRKRETSHARKVNGHATSSPISSPWWVSKTPYLTAATLLGASWRSTPPSEWENRRQQVKDAFVSSWDAYSKYAWGYDQFHPISKQGSMMSPKGLCWIIVDSLDTMMIMNLASQLADARSWLHRSLDYEQDQDVNTSETTIRIIHLASRRGLVSDADGGASSTAEATTLQIEMKYLSNVTGNEIYWRKAEKVMEVVDSVNVHDGLIPIFITPRSGQFTTREIRLGKYLIKQYLQTSEPIYLQMWEEALIGIQKHLIIPTKHAKLIIVAELPSEIGGSLSPKMDPLVCFPPGTIALGATNGLTEAEARRLPSWNNDTSQQMKLARKLTKTCWGMYKVTDTGIAPEFVWFQASDDSLQSRKSMPRAPLARSSNSEEVWKKDFNIKPLDAHNLQRPETVESLFMMWRITKDPIYPEWGWEIFQAFLDYSTVPLREDFISLNDVNAIPPPRRDNMESFWLAETLKYLYLLFSPDDVLPLTDVVFNIEAHVFPRMGMGKFKTGWQRKPRKSARGP
ncbi:mannosyl-oligosaccharide 1,2-alpha-mannosidase [Alternaria rosae]|uniref:mannosyl-oligosaccharide 1,2-alpha-mannosidase n=1 Tax=Alternaria rosae TaxID=1187941 RepID=UPI001E8DF7AE|nr:mannosyl-oligosaccharide 1,2-alpha-mannosidase [Alternaria rosae]KAH6864713.1 mannosyl-oligosaccharide 1,2-alpha-mannosidase [Alternaria rosae]